MDLTSVVVPGPGCALVHVAGEAVVVQEDAARLHVLDRHALALWGLLDGQRPLREVARALAEAFCAPEDVVARDVLDVVAALVAAGALEEALPLRPDAL